ncbi:MAG: LysE family transporter [Candidatus Omnitrophica bacterium]|nr:LysE family transporter [Candidatus Omnitrophota bacterium]
MTEYILISLVSFTIAFSGALMPGPLLTAVISQSVKHGFKSGPLICVGHALMEALMIGVIIFGLASFIHNQTLMLAISILGALILAFFGVGMISSIPKLNLETQTKPVRSSSLILLGITMSITNPYWSIWWLSIGLGLTLAAKKSGLTAVIIFFLGHILADFIWYGLVALVISKGRKFISLKVYRRIIFVCGLALIGFSIYFASNSLKPL